MKAESVLEAWLIRRLPAQNAAWLQESAGRIRTGATEKDLYLAVSMVPRKIGKADLAPNNEDLQQADSARRGWDPRAWSVDQAARIYLLLAGSDDPERFARRLDQLCITADIAELVAFYSGLPLYPDPPRYVLRAAEGVRTNMKAVFEAVAHRNPYPAEQLPEPAWNQMVLKALFIGSRLDPIVGIDQRANATLARMLTDYAHERWAAGRPVSPELWRCVGPFAAGAMLEDFKRVLDKGIENERAAAALALSRSSDPAAAELVRSQPALHQAVREGKISWAALVPAH